MAKASEVAIQLRKFADNLDRNPDAEIASGRVSFYHKLLPRPLKKGDGYSREEMTLEHEDDALTVYATIDKSLTCELIAPARPAEYRCISVLSPEEEAEVIA